jgi:RNA polymerase sigma-70 factor, ECF subfamily
MSQRLRTVLLRANLDPAGLAAAVGVDAKTVTRWLSSRIPHQRARLAVADLLGETEAGLWPQTRPDLAATLSTSANPTVSRFTTLFGSACGVTPNAATGLTSGSRRSTTVASNHGMVALMRRETSTDVAVAFDRRIDPYRTELLAHCYRMLGSVHDAEDLVQETYLRAWRAQDQYDESRSSLRTWLYRIATNACLTALAGRGRRPLPAGLVAESDPRRPFVHGGEITWLQPLPDSLLRLGEPEAATIDRGRLRLAFVAAVQHLSARQRAALILREVLDFSAAEAAAILNTTTASVNSSLQRARARLKEAGVLEEQFAEPSDAEQRAWVDRYLKAFAGADVEGLKRLLTDDVVMEMPPMVNWFAGRENYGVFMDWVFAANGSEWRFLPVGANAQPAFAAYNRAPSGAFELHTLQVFTVTKNGISRTSVFRDAEVFAAFELPATLEAGPR